MKFKIPMQDEIGIDVAVHQAVTHEIESSQIYEFLTPDEVAVRVRNRKTEVFEFLFRWFERGGYLTVEVDTEKETCEIVRVDG